MAKIAQDTENVTGLVLRAFPARKAGKYTVYDFVLRTPTGDLKVSRFGSGVQEHVGETVSFDATYNEQYDRYTVQGDVQGSDDHALGETEAGVPTGAPVAKVKRGRPASGSLQPLTATPQTIAHAPVAEGSREVYRAEAVSSIILNLQSAQHIAEALNLKATLQDLVNLGDMVGRTVTAIKISAEKRN